MTRFTISIIVLTLGLFSCQNTDSSSQTEEAETTPSADIGEANNWQLTTSEGFNIHHPADWEVDLSGFMGSKFLLYLPKKEGDEFRENLNLMSQQLPNVPADLNALGDLMLKQLPSYVTDADIMTHGVSEDGQYFEASYAGKQSGLALSWYQRCFLKGSVAHILAYTADQKDFKASLTAAKQCMNTFQLPKK